MCEFDYHNEANSLSTVRENLIRSPYRKRVRVPQPYNNLCCKHLLVMEFLHGKKLTDDIEDKLAAIIGNKDQAAELLAKKQKGAYLCTVDQQVLIFEEIIALMCLHSTKRSCLEKMMQCPRTAA
jgi:hypothetical protein